MSKLANAYVFLLTLALVSNTTAPSMADPSKMGSGIEIKSKLIEINKKYNELTDSTFDECRHLLHEAAEAWRNHRIGEYKQKIEEFKSCRKKKFAEWESCRKQVLNEVERKIKEKCGYLQEEGKALKDTRGNDYLFLQKFKEYISCEERVLNEETIKAEFNWLKDVLTPEHIEKSEVRYRRGSLIGELQKGKEVEPWTQDFQKEIERYLVTHPKSRPPDSGCSDYLNNAKEIVEDNPDLALRLIEQYDKCRKENWSDALNEAKMLEDIEIEKKSKEHAPFYTGLLVIGGVSCLTLIGIFTILLNNLLHKRKADKSRNRDND